MNYADVHNKVQVQAKSRQLFITKGNLERERCRKKLRQWTADAERKLTV